MYHVEIPVGGNIFDTTTNTLLICNESSVDSAVNDCKICRASDALCDDLLCGGYSRLDGKYVYFTEAK